MADALDVSGLFCPACESPMTIAAMAGNVCLCGSCGASLVLEAGGFRRAVHRDVADLSADELKQLRHARGQRAL